MAALAPGGSRGVRVEEQEHVAPRAARAPAFIWRARPRVAHQVGARRDNRSATRGVRSRLPPSTTMTSASGHSDRRWDKQTLEMIRVVEYGTTTAQHATTIILSNESNAGLLPRSHRGRSEARIASAAASPSQGRDPPRVPSALAQRAARDGERRGGWQHADPRGGSCRARSVWPSRRRRSSARCTARTAPGACRHHQPEPVIDSGREVEGARAPARGPPTHPRSIRSRAA
jgi:hypothetical protein